MDSLRIVANLLAASLLAACAMVFVGFTLEAELVEITSRGGPRWTKVEADDLPLGFRQSDGATYRLSYPEGDVYFSFDAGAEGFSSRIRSEVPGYFCMRFDQTQLSSNLQSEKVQLKIHRALRAKPDGTFQNLGVKREAGEEFTSPPFCFQQGRTERFTIFPKIAGVFPSTYMFNARWVGANPNLEESGVGNWLILHVPVEFQNRREDIAIKLVAKSSRSRVVHSIF